jgi:hypothetical protein
VTAPTRCRTVAVRVLAALAAVAHLGVGFLYVVSGLSVPVYVVAALLVWWAVLSVVLLRLVQRRSWWTPAVPLVGIATWFVVLSAGSAIFGWTA